MAILGPLKWERNTDPSIRSKDDATASTYVWPTVVRRVKISILAFPLSSVCTHRGAGTVQPLIVGLKRLSGLGSGGATNRRWADPPVMGGLIFIRKDLGFGI